MTAENEGTAYHEAGHMVVAWDLGLAVTGATIIPNEEEGYSGCVTCPVENRVRHASWVDEQEYLYCHLVVYFAGVAASEKYTGVPLPSPAVQLALESHGSDYHNVGDYILALGGPDFDKQEEIGDRAMRDAAFLVETLWKRVEAVASVLVERQTLDEGECRRVLQWVFTNW